MKNKLLLIETVILTIIICSYLGKSDIPKENTPYPSTSVTTIEAEKEITNDKNQNNKPSQEIIDEATGTLKQFIKGEITVDDVRIRLENYIDKKLAE